MPSEASYCCGSCVEDCPVCCHPHVLRVRIGPDGEVELDARPE